MVPRPPREHKSVNAAEVALIEAENATAVDQGHGAVASRRAVIMRLSIFSVATMIVATIYANQKASLPLF